MKPIVMAVIATVALLIVVTPTEAKRCDGFNGCRCGVTAARLHGLPLNYHGLNLKMARSYYAFPHTTCHAGAIGIPHAHHVLTIRQCNGDGTALVQDEKGTYTRRTGGMVFVDASGNVAPRQTVTFSAHHHRHHYRQYAPRYAPQFAVQYASYNY